MAKNDTVLEPSQKINTSQKPSKNEASSKIETIRNLIFGENIEEYNSEFEALKRDILQKKKELESLVEEVRQDLNSAIDGVATDAGIRLTELESKLEDKMKDLDGAKVDKNTLGKMLTELGEKLSQK